MRTLDAGYMEWMDIEKKRMDTKEIGKLSQIRRLELTDWQRQPFFCRSACQNITVSAGALVLLQLAHKLMGLLHRLVLGPAFSGLAGRTSWGWWDLVGPQPLCSNHINTSGSSSLSQRNVSAYGLQWAVEKKMFFEDKLHVYLGSLSA